MKKITDDIIYVGVNDHNVDLFEGQYKVPNGMAYNSYVILDDKIAVMDSVDKNFSAQWLENIATALNERKPDYLVVQHMEPDHSGGIANFMRTYPEAKIVTSAKAVAMLKNFNGVDFAPQAVAEGESLELGKHTLTFFAAPMVHWPEVIVTYDKTDKVLFSADGFGKFGALDTQEDWDAEAARYYFGIVGKFGAQVQSLLKKAVTLDIEKICPLHGPVLTENLAKYINAYNIWSSYQPELNGVFIAYTSVYGNTKKAVEQLVNKLRAQGVNNVKVADLARSDMAEAVADAFRYDKMMLATTTYNGSIFPFMKTFIDQLTERNYKKRFVALIENGTWAPVAANAMRKLFEKSQDIVFAETTVTIKSAVDSTIDSKLDELVKEITQ